MRLPERHSATVVDHAAEIRGSQGRSQEDSRDPPWMAVVPHP